LKGVRLFKKKKRGINPFEMFEAAPVDSRAPIETETEAMAKIDATQLAFPFNLHPWGSFLIKPRRIRLCPLALP
jgi:hypothetical protein